MRGAGMGGGSSPFIYYGCQAPYIVCNYDVTYMYILSRNSVAVAIAALVEKNPVRRRPRV